MASQCKANASSRAGRKISHDEYEGERDRRRARMRDQETKMRDLPPALRTQAPSN